MGYLSIWNVSFLSMFCDFDIVDKTYFNAFKQNQLLLSSHCELTYLIYGTTLIKFQ